MTDTSQVNNTLTAQVIDYGGGNLGSLLRCLERLHIPYQTVDGQTQTLTAEQPIILPGVGAFGALVQQLHNRQLFNPIQTLVKQGTPFLGVCVGLQVLFEGSEESPGVAGLRLMPGKVIRFTQARKIPQMGWNHIETVNDPNAPEGDVYFVNSYVARPEDENGILYRSHYDEPFCAAVQHQNMTAFQFHPEKSGYFGHQLVQRWWEKIL